MIVPKLVKHLIFYWTESTIPCQNRSINKSKLSSKLYSEKSNPERSTEWRDIVLLLLLFLSSFSPPLLSTQFTSRPELPLENVMNFWPLVMDLSLDVPPPTTENRTRIVYNSWTLVPPDNLTSTDVILCESVCATCVCVTPGGVSHRTNIYVIQWNSETIRGNC